MPRFRLVDFLFKAMVSLFFIGQLYVNLWANVGSERGQVWEGLKFFSQILNKKVRYTIYVPFDYQLSTRRYPVLYLLHGYTDNDTAAYAWRHPEMFAAAAAFSVACWTDEEIINLPEKVYEKILAPLFGPGLKGKERLTEHFRSYHPLDLVKSRPVDKLKTVRLYLDCGDDDFLYKGNAALHVALRDRQIPHEFRARDGGHTWRYWRSGLLEALKFISQSFHR